MEVWLQNNFEQPLPTQQVESGLSGRSKTKHFCFVVFVFPVTWDSSELTQQATSGKHWNSVSFQRRGRLIFQFFFVLMSLPSI